MCAFHRQGRPSTPNKTMTKTDLLIHADASVKLVEASLSKIEKLTNDQKELADAIEAAKQSESEILASDAKEESKVKSLLKVRAEIDVKQANLAKLKNEILATQAETIALGGRANQWLGSLRDGVIPARKDRIGSQVKPLFPAAAHLEIDRLLNFALAVKEIDELDQLLFPASNVELSLASCRKVRSHYDVLAGAANSEPELVEIIASENWLAPVEPRRITGDAFMFMPSANMIGAL
jgi:hypothetical protein